MRVWLLVQQSYSHCILYIHLIKSRRAFPNQLNKLYAKGWTRYTSATTEVKQKLCEELSENSHTNLTEDTAESVSC